jgi:dipeptidyl aminopeptidase/acylaminoacyl peptidase
MNRHDDLDRLLSAWLEDPHVSPAPRYLDDVLQRTRRTRQRPAWASLERWLPMSIALRTPVLPLPVGRLALGLTLLLALLLTLSSLPFLAGTLLSPSPEETSTSGLIAFDREGDIYVVDPPDGEPRLLVGGPTEDVAPLWSPDGQRLLFVRVDGSTETLLVTDATGRPPTALDPEPLRDLQGMAWSPDSKMVAVTYGDGLSTLQTISFLDGDGNGEVAFDGGPAEPWSGADMPAWRVPVDAGSPGALLYRSIDFPSSLRLVDGALPDDSQVMLQVADIDGGRNSGNGFVYDFLYPAWSPDGTRFAYHTLQDLASVPNDPGFRVHVARPGEIGTPASDTRVEYDAKSSDEFNVAWSPDGSRLAFQAVNCPVGNPQACESARLVIVTLSPQDDLPTATLVTDPLPATDWYSLGYAWAPDGSSLALVNFGAPDRDAYLVDAQTGALEPLGWSADGDPSWQRTGT